MNTTTELCRFLRGRWYVAVAGSTLMAWANVVGGDVQLPLLKTRTGSYTNVTVTGASRTDIYIFHAQGVTNIKIDDLDPETVGLLGLANLRNRASTSTPVTASSKNGGGRPSSAGRGSSFSVPGFVSEIKQKMPSSLARLERLSSFRPSNEMLLTGLALILCAYLFICYCLKLICQKSGQKPGLMVWCPVVQILPLLRAAGMSGWWLLGFLIPLVNMIAGVLWSFKIVQARGKNSAVAIFLILPVTSFFAFLYLAFSDGAAREEATDRREMPLGPLLVDA